MITRIAVVVPAANEQDTIGACLEAVVEAAARVDCAVDVAVVLDGCTDATADIVAHFPGVQTTVTGLRNVGHARARGVAHLLAGNEARDDTLVASTDADSRVPIDWLTGFVTLAASADLILGTVVPDGELDLRVAQVWRDRHDPTDGHHHVHGANLAIRAGAYLALGGWSPLATGEDVDLVRRARDRGLRVHETGRLPVRTSARSLGRAPAGFAGYLRALGA